MDLSLPRFAGLTDWLRQIHPPWSIASDSPASLAPARLGTNGEEYLRCSVDQMSVSSACLNLDLFSSSSEDDSKDSAEHSDVSFPRGVSSKGQSDSSSGGVPVRRAVSLGGRLRPINSMIPLFRWLTL